MSRVRRALRWAVAAALLPAAVGLAASESSAARYKAIVVDADSGRVLFSRHADKRHYPASLAKMMTLYLVFEAVDSGRLRFDQRVRVSKRAAGQTPSKLGLKPGRSIPVEDAVLAMITKSANDATTVLAEAIAGTEVNFAKRMTATARRLGMKKTVFRNATGLPNRRQISTARDLALLARRLIDDYPHHYHYFSTRSFRWGKRTYRNHNTLLKTYDGVDGLKTGYIRASGFNIATSARRGGKRIVGIVLGGRTSKWRDRQMAHLLNAAFDRLRTARVEARKRTPPKRKPAPGVPRKLAAAGAHANALGPGRIPRPKPRSSKLDLLKPKPPVPAGAGAREAGGWGIQVGTYSAYAAALRQIGEAADALPDLLRSARTAVDRTVGDSRPLYRARFLGFSERTAREACRRLVLHRLACIPVPPKGGFVTLARN